MTKTVLDLDAALSNNVDKSIQAKTMKEIFKPIDDVQEGEGLKILIFGKAETGKTFFGLSCPGEINVISTEFGVKKLRHHFPDKKINLVECNIPFAEKPRDRKGQLVDTPFNVDPETSLRKIEDASFALEEIQGGTILFDSGSDLWGWLTLWLGNVGERGYSQKTGEEYIKGSEWAKITEAFRVLINRFNSLPCHLVVTAREKEDQQGLATFRTQKDADHYFDLVIHNEKIAQAIPGQEGKYTYFRQGTVTKCRYQALNNLTIPDITFDKLKTEVLKVAPNLEKIFEINLKD